MRRTLRVAFSALAAALVLGPRAVYGQAGVTGVGFEFDGDDVTVPFSPTPSAPTPLWRYVLDGNAVGVEALLAEGAIADIEVRDAAGHTPLTFTANTGRRRMLIILIDAGADKTALDPTGSPALSLATRSGYLELVRALVDNGADPNAVDFNNLSPLWHAARQGSLEMVVLLFEAGATLEHRDHQNYAPLTWAALQGRADMVQILVMSGADPGILNEVIMDRLWASEVGCNSDPQYDAVAVGCPSAMVDRGLTTRDYLRVDMVQMLEDAIASRRLSGTSRGKVGM